MLYIPNSSTSPYFNLALEEYLLKVSPISEDLVLLWQNDNTVVVGKHQNTLEEINPAYVEANQIRVARRISGGGAVYHDLGNLNFTFITAVERFDTLEMKKYALPVVRALEKMGVKAELNGRNDITIAGKKFSGTAQAIARKRLLFHGTLLFNSDLDRLGLALNASLDKIQSKGVKSVRSRVTNIFEHLPDQSLTIEDFKTLLLKYLFEDEPLREYSFTASEQDQIHTLEKDKFMTWDWNYGASPPYNYQNRKRFPGGSVELRLNVVKGLIESCKIYGDFLGIESVDPVETAVVGQKHNRSDIQAVLSRLPLERYFGIVTEEELLSCFMDSQADLTT